MLLVVEEKSLFLLLRRKGVLRPKDAVAIIVKENIGIFYGKFLFSAVVVVAVVVRRRREIVRPVCVCVAFDINQERTEYE
jgi:ribosomal protein L14